MLLRLYDSIFLPSFFYSLACAVTEVCKDNVQLHIIA